MPYKPDDPNGKEPPDNVPAGKRAQWSAIFNSTYNDTGSEARAFAAANAILEKQAMTNKAVLYRQSEAQYTTASTQPGVQQCANCRFFTPCEGGGYCQIVEDYPNAILATGWCSQWVEMPANEAEPTPVIVVAEMEDDMMEMAYQGLAQPTAEGALNKVLRRKEDGVTVWKGEDGLRMALIVGSNGYKDRDNEHIATAALKEYVDSQWKDGEWIGKNRAKFWHVVDIGDIIFAHLSDGFLVEVAKERKGLLPRIMWDYIEDNPDGIEWGASIGFKMLEPKDGDTFRHIDKQETSILPREAASNVLTYSEVIDMQNVSDILARITGVPEAAALLKDKKIGELNHRLEAAGLQAKAAQVDAPETDGEETTKEQTPEYPALVEKLATVVVEMMEAQGELVEELDAIKAAQTANDEAREKSVSDVNTLMESVRQDMADIKAILADEPRASKSAKTEVTDQKTISELDSQKSKGVPHPMFGDAFDTEAYKRYTEERYNGDK